MYQNQKSVLIFGVGPLQKSIIGRARLLGLYTVGIDPAENAACRNEVDAFEVVGGQNYEGTCSVIERYGIDAIVTAATDKPLVMMARVAQKYHFPFYSVDTAQWSTDKYQMKQRFAEGGVPCAKGRLVKSADEADDFEYPVIVKPRDNSGSRGVKLCHCKEELRTSMEEALEVSRLDSVLVEEFIEGPEYSIESLHYGGRSDVVQFTEKKTTAFPYNVELGHRQPAMLPAAQQDDIRAVVKRIADCLQYENCPAHTELKINRRGIFVIESSPRLGGDYITSTLTPLSTGVNMEDQLLHIALGEATDMGEKQEAAAGVCFFSLPTGVITGIDSAMDTITTWPGVCDFEFKLHAGDRVNPITSSLNRYGHFIVSATGRDSLDKLMDDYSKKIDNMIKVAKTIKNK